MCFRKTINSSQFRATRTSFFLYVFSSKRFLSLIFLKKHCNCPSLVNLGLSFSFLNFVVSLIISKIFWLDISLSRITAPLPVSGLTITMSFLVLSFFKIPCFLNVFWVGFYEDQYTFARFELVAFNSPDFLSSFKSRNNERVKKYNR